MNHKNNIYFIAFNFCIANLLFFIPCVPHAENAAIVSEMIAPSRDGDLLILAIENNDETKVEELLKKKINPNSRGFKNKYMSPLKFAASKNNKNIVDSLIKHGANVREKGVVSFSLGSLEVLKLLIAHGADVNDNSLNWSSPIHNAISSELLDSADFLIKSGANINDQNNLSRRTPLQNAAQYGKERSVKWLLEQGANVNLTDSSGQSAFVIGAGYKANPKILKLLVDYGSPLPSPKEIKTITQGACRAGNFEALEFIISMGNSIDFDKCYAALAELPSPSKDMLQWLVDHSKIKNVQVEKESLLHVAVENNSLKIAELLIASGVDVNVRDDNGRPPGAIWDSSEPPKNADYREMIALLASHGADFNIKYGQKRTTALHELVGNNMCADTTKEWETQCKIVSETIELLIASGADVNAFDVSSNTPLHFAANSNNIVLIELLVKHGADLKFTNTMGQTPLMLSIARGSWGNNLNRELLTIKTLTYLESKTGNPPDWAQIKEIANKVNEPSEKKQTLKLLEQLEKKPL